LVSIAYTQPKRGEAVREAIIILGLIGTMDLAACADDPVGRARENMERSRNAYMACIDRNAETPASCNEYKAAFDENMKQYMAIPSPTLSP
jgi:hypothetical protein